MTGTWNKVKAGLEALLLVAVVAGVVWSVVHFAAKAAPQKERGVKCPACGAELELKKKE